MDILEINDQSLSSILLDFYMCANCKTVDRNMDRGIVGYVCPDCGNSGSGGRNFFPITVATLVDLIQDYYHLSKGALERKLSKGIGTTKLSLAVIIFFCTLGDVLLENFLVECMEEQDIPKKVQSRLLDDTLFSKQRINKLFPLFTGASWNSVIQKLDGKAELNYKETISFYLDVVEKRNKALHKGYVWNVPSDMPEQCLQNIWPLVSLFVALHNEFIRSI